MIQSLNPHPKNPKGETKENETNEPQEGTFRSNEDMKTPELREIKLGRRREHAVVPVGFQKPEKS